MSGQSRNSRSVRLAHASTRCSQLSRMISSRRYCNASASQTAGGRLPSSRRSGLPPASTACCPGRACCRRRSSTAATAAGTSAGSATPARLTSQAPCEYTATRSVAAAIASTVFPIPPAPTSVTSRAPSRSAWSSASDSSRPSSPVSAAGRLWRRAASGVACAAAGDAAAGWRSARRRSGRRPSRGELLAFRLGEVQGCRESPHRFRIRLSLATFEVLDAASIDLGSLRQRDL